MNDARVALSRVNLRDAFVMAETADIFVSQMTQFSQANEAAAESLTESARVSLEHAYGYGSPSREERKPFVYQDGIAIIPIHGALLNRFGGAYSFATGYNYIRRMMLAAIDDDDVDLIVFDVDSPGGEAAGCFELANEIREARVQKPMVAVVDSLSCSAGYALASATSKMFATPSSKIGSIGVVRMHINMKGAMDRMGVEVTFIEAPKDGMKTAGNPYEKLSDEAKKEFQESVDKAYEDFVELIEANRGLSGDAIRETKARVFRADEALALGLIDEVKTPSEAVSSFLAELADEDDPENEEDDDMSTATGKTAATAAPAAAAPAATEVASAPSQDAINAAVTADRERMTSIKALPEAASRPKLADTLTMGGYTVDQAKALLTAAAEETPAAAPAATAPAATAPAATAPAVDTVNHLDAAMSNTTQPNVGAGAEGTAASTTTTAPSDADLSAAILKDHSAMTGATYEAPAAA